MAYDAHKNFAISRIATAPSPNTSGTSLVVKAGDGAIFPAASFNATCFPPNENPTSGNAEIVRVTNVSTDTFTITRAQETSTAKNIDVGWYIFAGPTVKTITDIEAAIPNGAWTSYVPTWTNFTPGNGVNSSSYMQIGKTVYFRIVFVLGTTSSVSGSIIYTLPVTSVTSPSATFQIASGHIDNGGGQFNAYSAWTNTTTATIRWWDTNNNGNATSSSAPGTFATNWVIVMRGEYEAA